MSVPNTGIEEELRVVDLRLAGFGAEATTARATVVTLTPARRLRRAGVALAVGFVAALITLPVPLVHFFFPPAALVGGFVVAFRRLGQRELFAQVDGRCPFCGADQRLPLSGALVRLPRELACKACRKPLRLEGTGA